MSVDGDDAEVCDDQVDAAHGGQWQTAFTHELAGAFPVTVIEDRDDLACASGEVHCAADTGDFFSGNHPIGEIAPLADLHGSEHRDIDVASTDHGKAHGRVECAASVDDRHRLFSGVNDLGVDLIVVGEGAHSKQSVLGMKDDSTGGINVVADQRRDADTKIDDASGGEFACGTRGDLSSGPGHGLWV